MKKKLTQAEIKNIRETNISSKKDLENLKELKKQNNPYIDIEISVFLLCNAKNISLNTILQDLLFSFTDTKCKFVSVINHLDFVLLELANTNKYLAFKFFSAWIQNSDFSKSTDRIDKLWNSYINSLLKDSELLPILFSRYFNSNEQKYHEVASQIINARFRNDIDNLFFSQEELEKCNLNDVEFILTKLIGYLISPEPLFKLTFSLAEIFSTDKNILLMIYQYVCFYHIYEYPNLLKDYVQNIIKQQNTNKNFIDFLKKIYTESENFIRTYKTNNEINELLPSANLVTKVYMHTTQENEVIMKKIKSESPLLSIMSESLILYGKGCNYFIDDKYIGETKFAEITASTPIPNSIVYNRVNFSHFLYQCQNMRRNNESDN